MINLFTRVSGEPGPGQDRAMTVIVGAAAPEGIVLAADSRTTFQDGDHHRVLSDAAQKVFGLFDRYAVATYGAALLAEKTIHGVMDEFITHTQTPPTDVQAFCHALGAFFDGRIQAILAAAGQTWTGPGWPLGFLAAGYDASGVGRVYEIGVPGPHINVISVDTATLGVLWRGQTDVIRRLIKGADLDGLANANVTVPDPPLTQINQLEYKLLLPITLRDAVDFSRFLIQTTIDMQRFSDGTLLAPRLVPACGGPIQAVIVTRDGIEWASQPAAPA
jgi:hypothetical protein